MADFTADEIVAKPALAAAVASAFTSATKQQAFAAKLVELFSGGVWRFARGGQPVCEVPIGPLTVNGATLQIGTATSQVAIAQAVDIDTGVWEAWLVKGSASLKAASVGRTAGVVRISVASATPNILPAGTASITSSGTITMPEFGTGSGAGQQGGGTFTPGAPPGSGWAEVLSAAGSPVTLPEAFYGWHRWGNQGPPQYNFRLNRSWDYVTSAGEFGCNWNTAHTGPGQFNWTHIDNWMASGEPYGHKMVYVVALTPNWLSSNPNPYPLPQPGAKYPWYVNGIWPPSDWSKLEEFIVALRNRYGTRIYAIEALNEPNTYDDSNYDVRATDKGVNKDALFSNYTMREQVRMGKTIAMNKHPSWQMWVGAWEGQSRWHNQAALYCRTPDHVGGLGIEHVDVFTWHPYMYNYEVDIIERDARTFRQQLQAFAASYGNSTWANTPILCSEVGHESPGIAINVSVDASAKHLKQHVGWAAIAAITANMRGTIFYQDRTSDVRTAWSPVNNYPAIKAASDYCHAAFNGGKTIRQAYTRRNNGAEQVWIRFSDNTEFLA